MPVTVTSTLNSTYHRLTITGTGGAGNTASIAEVYTASNAARSGSMSYDSGSNTYTINILTATIYTALYINDNCTLQIPEDTKLVNIGEVNAAGGSNNIFNHAIHANLILRPGSGIKFSNTGGYMYLYGSVQAIGTEAKPITWQTYRSAFMYLRRPNATNTFQWVVFKNNPFGSGYYMQFSRGDQPLARPIIIRNVKFTHDSQLKYGYAMAFSGGNFSNITIENVQYEYLYCAIYGSIAGFKIKNATVKNCSYTYNVFIQGNTDVNGMCYQTSQNDVNYPTQSYQPLVWLQNISFDGLANDAYYAIASFYNALVYTKNCTFNRTTGSTTYRGLASYYNGIIIQNGNDYNGIIANPSRKILSGDGTILHGHQLDLTVLDSNSNPIQNASVVIMQKSATPKQKWSGFTNADGKLLNTYNTNSIYIQKQQTSLNVFQDWSDPGHSLIINAVGYKQSITDVVFTADKTYRIKLKPVPEIKEDSMEYNIVQAIYSALQDITDIKYLGYYPYDFDKVTMNMPAVLIKYSDSVVQALGHHRYNVQASTDILLYRDRNDIASALSIESQIIDTIVQTLHGLSGQCITGIGNFEVYTGDINQYIQPSTTGYNGQIIVRKLTVNYAFDKII